MAEVVKAEKKATAVAVEDSFLEGVAGSGFEKMENSDTTIPLLLISQQTSEIVQSGKLPAGVFYNSVTYEDYGPIVKMVVVKFEKMWYEWLPNAGGLAGIHKPFSIEVTGDSFNGMFHGENPVEEKWVYIVVLPEHLDAGYLMFTSTKGNLRYLKNWNTQMKCIRLSSGKLAPIFYGIWEATLGKDTNKDGKKYYSCSFEGKSSFTLKGTIDSKMYEQFVKPAVKQSFDADTEGTY